MGEQSRPRCGRQWMPGGCTVGRRLLFGESERDFSILSLTLSNLRCAIDGDKVKKIIFLRLNAKHIPEVREVTSQLAKQSEEQEAFREKSKAVQSAHAWQDRRYKILTKMGGAACCTVVDSLRAYKYTEVVRRGSEREELSSRFVILFSIAWS